MAEERLRSSRAAAPPGGGSYARLPSEEKVDDEVLLLREELPDLDALESGIPLDWRSRAIEMIDSVNFQCIVMGLIIANALVLGFETDMPDAFRWEIFEHIFLLVFTAELIVRLIIIGPLEYFDFEGADIAWNIFDVLVIGFGISDVVLEMFTGMTSGGLPTLFRIVRLVRIMRVFKIVRTLKALYLIAFGFGEAATAILWVAIFMVVMLYLAAVLITRIVGQTPNADPNYDFIMERFGSVTHSMFTLFELMAAPDLPKYEELSPDIFWNHTGLCFFLITYVLFGSFGMIAILSGVICESMFEKNEMRNEEARIEKEQRRIKLSEGCEGLFQTLNTDEEGEADMEDVKHILPQLTQILKENSVDYTDGDLENMCHLMDTNHNGSVSKTEFIHAVLFQAEGVKPMSMQEMLYDVSWVKHKLEKVSCSIEKLLELHSQKLCEIESPNSETRAGGEHRESRRATAPGGAVLHHAMARQRSHSVDCTSGAARSQPLSPETGPLPAPEGFADGRSAESDVNVLRRLDALDRHLSDMKENLASEIRSLLQEPLLLPCSGGISASAGLAPHRLTCAANGATWKLSCASDGNFESSSTGVDSVKDLLPALTGCSTSAAEGKLGHHSCALTPPFPPSPLKGLGEGSPASQSQGYQSLSSEATLVAERFAVAVHNLSAEAAMAVNNLSVEASGMAARFATAVKANERSGKTAGEPELAAMTLASTPAAGKLSLLSPGGELHRAGLLPMSPLEPRQASHVNATS